MTKPIKIKTSDIAVAAIFLSLILLFVFVPINIFGIDIAFIPLIAIFIAADVKGLGMGLFAGCSFGLASLSAAFLRPNPFSPMFYNPLVSVVPRIIIPIAVYFTFKLVKKLMRKAPQEVSTFTASSASAIAGVLTNTTLVVSMMVAFNFGKTYGGTVIGKAFVLALLGGNFLIEIVSCAIVTPILCVALRLALKIDRRGKRNAQVPAEALPEKAENGADISQSIEGSDRIEDEDPESEKAGEKAPENEE